MGARPKEKPTQISQKETKPPTQPSSSRSKRVQERKLIPLPSHISPPPRNLRCPEKIPSPSLPSTNPHFPPALEAEPTQVNQEILPTQPSRGSPPEQSRAERNTPAPGAAVPGKPTQLEGLSTPGPYRSSTQVRTQRRTSPKITQLEAKSIPAPRARIQSVLVKASKHMAPGPRIEKEIEHPPTQNSKALHTLHPTQPSGSKRSTRIQLIQQQLSDLCQNSGKNSKKCPKITPTGPWTP